MLELRHLIALACVFALGGCFESHSLGGGDDRCDVERACFAVDTLGCCGDRSVSVSVCEMCPPGMAEQASCRTAGCEVDCTMPLLCRQDLGGGCCDVQVFNESCDSCPAGSMPADRCMQNVPECGCDEVRPLIPPICYPDLGGGCCGGGPEDGVEPGPCGCPDGYVLNWDCMYDGDVPAVECFADEGGGCCGVPVASACGRCPEGSLPAAECPAFGGEVPPEDDADPGAPRPEPPELPECHVDLGDGRCGCPVPANSCGLCPSEATRDCSVIDCLMP